MATLTISGNPGNDYVIIFHRIPTAQYDGLWHGGTWLIQVQLITVVCLIAWSAVSSYVILWVSGHGSAKRWALGCVILLLTPLGHGERAKRERVNAT